MPFTLASPSPDVASYAWSASPIAFITQLNARDVETLTLEDASVERQCLRASAQEILRHSRAVNVFPAGGDDEPAALQAPASPVVKRLIGRVQKVTRAKPPIFELDDEA